MSLLSPLRSFLFAPRHAQQSGGFRRSCGKNRRTRRLILEKLENRIVPSGFVDGFEGATLNSFWSPYLQSGSLSLSTAQAHSGLQSVQFTSTQTSQNKDIQLDHDFGAPTFGKFSVWMYDTGAGVSSSNYIALALYDSITNAGGMVVGTQDFDLGPSNGGSYDFGGSTVGSYNSGIVRSLAWHQFTITTLPSGTQVAIDGVQVYSSPIVLHDNIVELHMTGPYWRPAWVSYFDDFEYDPATDHFLVSGFPSPTTAGTAQSFTVTAEDGSGNVVSSYTGTVHFSSTDSQAVLPADYAFTATDAGQHTFSATLKTAGSQSLTAMDAMTATLTGSETGITVNPAAASHLIVGAPPSSTAGTAFSMTVSALDPYGNTASGYTGTDHFSSSDKKAALPADYTFTGGDAGVHIFSNAVALVTAGSQTITATDTVTGSITGKSSTIKVSAAALNHLKIKAVTSTTAGTAFGITVTAQDAFNNTVTSYSGTIHFTSSDIQALLPADYTFTSTNKGVHSFSGVTLKTAGTESITATDTVTASVTGSASLPVKPGKASSLSITAPSSVTQGVAFTFTVTALDAYGNVASGYTGTVHFSSSDAAASLPVNYTFISSDAGVETFTAILNTTGSQTLTATDTMTPSITGTDPSIQVTAGTAGVRLGSITSLTESMSAPDLAIRIASLLGNGKGIESGTALNTDGWEWVSKRNQFWAAT